MNVWKQSNGLKVVDVPLTLKQIEFLQMVMTTELEAGYSDPYGIDQLHGILKQAHEEGLSTHLES